MRTIYQIRECVRAGAAGSRTRRYLGHHLLHPLILRPRALFYRTDCTRRTKFLCNAYPAVFKDLIPRGSSRILVPQTPGIKIWSPQNSPSSSTFRRGSRGAKACLLTVKLTNFSVQKTLGCLIL